MFPGSEPGEGKTRGQTIESEKGRAEIRLSRVESSSPVPSDPGSWSRKKKRQWGQGGWGLNRSVSELRTGYYQGQ